MTEALSASLEDYLEAIFLIAASKGAARSKDIAAHLTVTGPSVTGALRLLSEKGLVNYAPYDVITLTAAGRELAESVVKRHEALREFCADVLLLDAPTAEATACQLEHVIRGPILERLVGFVEFIKRCPRGGHQWIRGFASLCESGEIGACAACIRQCLDAVASTSTTEGAPSPMPVTLTTLQPGQKGAITTITAQGSLRRRMLDMGLTPGTLVEVERVAPLGDPIDVKVKGYHLSLRREETACIAVEPRA
ncbi:MAG TPA: metal-dependent transcriptional regulator [Armatimonadota bacterium]|nr:metal-dependent transcriptional regulator [Armatimonadota bacterium]